MTARLDFDVEHVPHGFSGVVCERVRGGNKDCVTV